MCKDGVVVALKIAGPSAENWSLAEYRRDYLRSKAVRALVWLKGTEGFGRTCSSHLPVTS